VLVNAISVNSEIVILLIAFLLDGKELKKSWRLLRSLLSHHHGCARMLVAQRCTFFAKAVGGCVVSPVVITRGNGFSLEDLSYPVTSDEGCVVRRSGQKR